MDNVTHGLFGLLVAEAALMARFGSKSLGPAGLRGAALYCSIAGNNVPDLDVLYAGVTEGKLGYLLHHRGHTHTIAVGLPLALLVLLPVWLWARKRKPSWSRADWGLLIGLSLFGPLLHVGLDFMNNYGVHPFWPVHNGWFYGDAVFIIEPLLFLVIGLCLAPECQTRAGRWFLWSAVALVLVLSWILPFVLWPWAVALTLLAGVLWLAGRKAARGARIVGAGALAFGVVVLFFASSYGMERRLLPLLAGERPPAATHDVLLTPMPANPLCWRLITVQTQGEDYVLRRGLASLAPAWLGASSCPQATEEGTTAPLRAVDLPSDERIMWDGEFRAPLSELQELAARHCQVAAYLRFARAPFFERRPGAVILGDLRYDREEGHGFAELEFDDPPRACPEVIPPWQPPRSGLL